MKRILKHLLWIIPSLILVVIVSAAVYSAVARRADTRYHVGLSKSLLVASDRFQPNQEMPVEYSCRGAGASPEIKWRGAPEGTQSYVLIATDWDAPSPALRLLAVSHWVLYNIPVTVNELPDKVVNDDLKKMNISIGLNIAGAEGYAPPCPPLGQHQYVFRVYALDADKIQPASNDKNGVMEAMQGHILAYGELIGLKSAG
jgi:Raf kinase inhibitor-like YbhB/YbcL family protein